MLSKINPVNQISGKFAVVQYRYISASRSQTSLKCLINDSRCYVTETRTSVSHVMGP